MQRINGLFVFFNQLKQREVYSNCFSAHRRQKIFVGAANFSFSVSIIFNIISFSLKQDRWKSSSAMTRRKIAFHHLRWHVSDFYPSFTSFFDDFTLMTLFYSGNRQRSHFSYSLLLTIYSSKGLSYSTTHTHHHLQQKTFVPCERHSSKEIAVLVMSIEASSSLRFGRRRPVAPDQQTDFRLSKFSSSSHNQRTFSLQNERATKFFSLFKSISACKREDFSSLSHRSATKKVDFSQIDMGESCECVYSYRNSMIVCAVREVQWAANNFSLSFQPGRWVKLCLWEKSVLTTNLFSHGRSFSEEVLVLWRRSASYQVFAAENRLDDIRD